MLKKHQKIAAKGQVLLSIYVSCLNVNDSSVHIVSSKKQSCSTSDFSSYVTDYHWIMLANYFSYPSLRSGSILVQPLITIQ